MVSRGFKLFIKVMPNLVEGYYEGRCISSVALEDNNELRRRSLFPALSKLTHAGILTAQTGGDNWGYTFLVDPKMLNLYDVMTAIQRLPYPTCTLKHHPDDDDCVVCGIISTALNSMAAQLRKVTVYEVYELAKAKRQADLDHSKSRRKKQQ